MSERGRSVVIEGNDGTGKSTQVDMLAERLKVDYGINSYVVHEPDGPGISSHIREIIKNGTLERQAMTNLLLFMASRYEQNHIGEQYLARGDWLLKARDRTSTEAYQGAGEGLSRQLIVQLHELTMTELYMHPDLKVILGIGDEAMRLIRIAGRGAIANPDTFEMRGQDFQAKVNMAYVQATARDRLPFIEATQTREAVHEEIMELIWARGLLERR